MSTDNNEARGVSLAVSFGGRGYCMTITHALAHLEAKGYHEVVSAKTPVFDGANEHAWMRLFVRPGKPTEEPRKAFLWVIDPAQVYIHAPVGRDGEGL